MTACWTVLTTHMVMYYSFIAYRYWLVFLHISMDLFGLLLYCFLVRHMQLPSPRSERLVKLWAASAMLWHFTAPLEYWWVGSYGFHLVGNIFIFYLFGRLVAKALRDRDGFSIAISLTILIQLGLFSHDIYLVLFAAAEDWESAMYFSQFAFPLLLLVFLATLLHRFVSALNLSEDLNRDLEAKVEASRVIIEQSYAARRELELAQATEQERLAIYRDLHDDVGSKLLSIVHTGRDSRLGELARTALESLRSAVSRANSPDQALPEFVAELREEAQLRLEGSGHEFIWTQAENLPETILPSDAVFNLNQVFRELVSNIIRHADASVVSITLDLRETGLHFTIHDNGRGLDSESLKGNGLKHIRQRVAELQGTLELDSAPQAGVTVEISIPISSGN